MDDPETIRQRAQEQLDQIDEMLAQRQRQRERAGGVEWTPPAAEPPATHTRAVAPSTRPQQREQSSSYRRDWDREQKWVEQIIDQRVGTATKDWLLKQLEAFAAALGDDMGRAEKADRAMLRAEFATALDAAKAELRADVAAERAAKAAEARYAALEARLIEAEQRAAPKPPARPQLVAGGSDGAD